jgi:UDP-N-acetylmuramate dehydrogenase
MDWSNGFADRVRKNVPLAERTWFKLGGSARELFSPADEDELCAVLRHARNAGVAVRVLGGGANLLVGDDGFDGLVICLDQAAFTGMKRDGSRVIAGGGVDLMTLARDCSYGGLTGLECLAGIPGTVGGAVKMNAGGRFGQMGDVVESARLADPAGTVEEWSARQLAFSYRRSAVGDRIVTRVTLGLREAPVEETRARFQEIWRFKKGTQPMAEHCAGCIFKNPPGDSAGRLIDAAGMKGVTLGRARVSDVHANFIVADGGARSADVLGLIERVRDAVQAKSGIRLELEIEVW